MNTVPLLALLISVSFLVKGLAAYADEFELFDKPPVVRSQEKAPAKVLTLSEAETAYKKNPKSYGNLKAYSFSLIENRKIKEAQDLLWNHIDQLQAAEMHLLIKSHLSLKQYDLALKAATLQTSKNEKDHIAFSLLGETRLAQKSEKPAIEAFNTAIQLRPDYEGAYLPLLEHYKNKKNNYEARILLQDLLKNVGRKAKYLTALCQVNLEDKTYQQALSVCREALQVDPKSAENKTNVGLALYYTDSEAKALQQLKTAADKNPQSDYSQIQYALILQGKKDFLGALNYFKRAASANEKSDLAWIGIATNSFDVLKYDDALAAYKKACQLNKNHGPAFRKAMITLRNAKNAQWTGPYEQASNQCVFGN